MSLNDDNDDNIVEIDEDEAFGDLRLNLSRELHNAGKFLYDGCEGFYNLSHKNMDYNLFDILLNLAIGVERVQKVILSLSEDKMEEPEKKALYEHKHQWLQEIIKRIYINDVFFNKNENKFIRLLQDFYNEDRYGFFNEEKREHKSLFLANDLFDSYCHSIKCTWFEKDFKNQEIERTKETIECVISNVVSKYIDCLKKISDNKNIYLTETQSNYELFIFVYHGKNVFDYFKKLEIARNELLYFLAQASIKDSTKKEYPPLDFEISDIEDFISYKDFDRVKSDLIEVVFNQYTEDYDEEQLEERKKFIRYFPKIFDYLYKKG